MPSGLEPLPALDLSTVESAAREQLQAQQNALDKLLAKGAPPRQLADAMGALGEVYHAYQLLGPAATCYRNAQQLDPESFLWPYYLGLAEQTGGRLDAALAAFQAAQALRPDNLPVRLRLGEVYLARGEAPAASLQFERAASDALFAAAAQFGLGRATSDPAQAVLHFKKALELDPQAMAVHHPLGLALRRLGQLDAAKPYLETPAGGEVAFPDPLRERLETLAKSGGALLRRGNQALMRGEIPAAIAAFRQAVVADPQNPETRRNLALALAKNQEVEAAIHELKTAIEERPDNAWLHYDLGKLYMNQGLVAAASDALKQAVELAPELVPAQFNLGSVLVSQGRFQEARTALAQVLRLEPENLDARFLAAMADHGLGASVAASQALRELLSQAPKNLNFREGLAKVLTESQRPGEALKVLQQGLAVDLAAADKTRLLTQLAELSWRQRETQPAIAYYREAVAVSPQSSTAHTNLANVLQLSGDYPAATQSFARAVELDPKNATAWLSEGTLWILQGDYARARQRLEQGLAQAPEHSGITHTLARLLATSPDASARDGQRALVLAHQAYNLEHKPEQAETIGMAMAELGQFEKAIQWQRSLMAQAAQLGDRGLLQQMAVHLRLYEQRQPVRITPQGRPR